MDEFEDILKNYGARIEEEDDKMVLTFEKDDSRDVLIDVWVFDSNTQEEQESSQNVLETEQQFRCSYCTKTFSSSIAAAEHGTTHTFDDHAATRSMYSDAERSRLCWVCGRMFSKHFYMMHHYARHVGGRPFLCDRCGLTFKIKKKLMDHAASEHLAPGNRSPASSSLSCEGSCCDEYIVRVKRLECALCGKFYSSKRNLTEHMLLHLQNLRPYKCEVCTASFQRKYGLTRHMSVHTRERHQCDECDMSFASEYYARLHQRRNHNGPKKRRVSKRFRCHPCGKAFSRKILLVTHQKKCTQSGMDNSGEPVVPPVQNNIRAGPSSPTYHVKSEEEYTVLDLSCKI